MAMRSTSLGVGLPRDALRQVAVWAFNLKSAYRRVAAARHGWWLQWFLSHDGVRLDSRCGFASAHLVGLFQRTSSFVMEVAREQIRRHDAGHPYEKARQGWQRWREREAGSAGCTFSNIYLDYGFGLTCTDGEPLKRTAHGNAAMAHVELQVSGVSM
ncbi:MAG: hypothetical protein SGPRY_004737 [Prymnesium sp.]